MKRFLLTLTAAALAALPLRAAPTDDEVAARNLAGEIAGAFANEGFKLRDGNWTGTFEVGKPKIIQVNLYAGNQYWFTLGSVPAAKKVAVTIYDESGKPVEIDPFQDVSVAAAGFSPQMSGSYYVKVEEIEGTKAAFCLIYSYK
jgi:hypothetical protein